MRSLLIVLVVCLAPSLAEARDCGLFEYRAIVTGAYDGDSVTADIDLGLGSWRHDAKLRLFGVDTPEIKSTDKARAIAVRDELRELILGKEVRICTIQDKTDKYGRFLVEIFFGNINVNAWLKMKKLGEPYYLK